MRKRYNNNNSGSNSNSGNRRGNYRSNSNHNSSSNNNRNNGGTPRPRKNFRALQEKFLNQAKDAMASGDRIMAEFYLQHADHYFRENEAFLAERAEWQEKRQSARKEQPKTSDAKSSTNEKTNKAATDNSRDDDDDDDNNGDDDGQEHDDRSADDDDDDVNTSGSSLPAFITQSGGKPVKTSRTKTVKIDEWDDED